MNRNFAVALAAVALGACVATPVYTYPQDTTPPPVAEAAPPPTVVVETAPAPVAAEPACVAQYGGIHPIPAEQGGGWCMIDGPHCHDYMPVYTDQYVFQNNVYVYGVAGMSWTYDGPHPIPPERGGGWCNIPGPHVHHYHPWADFGYDPVRHIYVYHQGHWGGRAPSYAHGHDGYGNRPHDGHDGYGNSSGNGYGNRPEPVPAAYPRDGREPGYGHHQPEPGRPTPTDAQHHPIPYGDDVRTHPAGTPNVMRPEPANGTVHPMPPQERPQPGMNEERPSPANPAEFHQRPGGEAVVRPNPALRPASGERPMGGPGMQRPNPIPTQVRPVQRVSQPKRGAAPNQRKRNEDEKKEHGGHRR